MEVKKVSPCFSCTRVRDPQNCENKNCNAWRQWFLGRWELIRSYPRQVNDHSVPEPAGVPLGGNYYAAPHQVEHYLHTDPCEDCLCPRDLCGTPCRVRRDWDDARNEVLL